MKRKTPKERAQEVLLDDVLWWGQQIAQDGASRSRWDQLREYAEHIADDVAALEWVESAERIFAIDSEEISKTWGAD